MFDTTVTHHLSIRDQLRMAGVLRWQIVATDRKQNVAEHTCNVMLIAAEIMRRAGGSPNSLGPPFNWSNVLTAVLYHDLPEVVIGDIPMPMKMAFGPGAQRELEEIEKCFKPCGPDLTKTERAILKAADMIDALQFLAKYGGNGHAANVYADLQNRLEGIREALPDHLSKVVGQVYLDAHSGPETYMEDLV